MVYSGWLGILDIICSVLVYWRYNGVYQGIFGYIMMHWWCIVVFGGVYWMYIECIGVCLGVLGVYWGY